MSNSHYDNYYSQNQLAMQNALTGNQFNNGFAQQLQGGMAASYEMERLKRLAQAAEAQREAERRVAEVEESKSRSHALLLIEEGG